MGARISDADTAELRVAIEKPAQSAVEPLSAALDAFCKKLQSDMAGGKVVFSCTHALVGDTLTLDARATNLRAAATASMEKEMRKARQPTSSTGRWSCLPVDAANAQPHGLTARWPTHVGLAGLRCTPAPQNNPVCTA